MAGISASRIHKTKVWSGLREKSVMPTSLSVEARMEMAIDITPWEKKLSTGT